jgi:hypothetical protein
MSDRHFVVQYWLAFVWIVLALFTLILVVDLIASKGSDFPTLMPFVLVGFCASSYRAFKNGYRITRDKDGIFMTIASNLLSLAFGMVIWPVAELIGQTRFLIKARSHWTQGEVLISEQGYELHGN